jgi:hypothetical protein
VTADAELPSVSGQLQKASKSAYNAKHWARFADNIKFFQQTMKTIQTMDAVPLTNTKAPSAGADEDFEDDDSHGMQAPFNSNACKKALANKEKTYKCGLNFMAISQNKVEVDQDVNVPIAQSSIDGQRKRYYSDGPTPLMDLIIGVLPDQVMSSGCNHMRGAGVNQQRANRYYVCIYHYRNISRASCDGKAAALIAHSATCRCYCLNDK